MKKPTPPVSKALIDYLKNKFPLSQVTSISTLEDLKYHQGRWDMISYLEKLYDQQERIDKVL